MTPRPEPDARKVVLCDVDEVVAALLPEWVRRYNDAYDDELQLAAITDWSLQRFVKPECGDKIYDFLNAPDLYEDVDPVPGALYGVNELRRRGYRVVFVTSATKGHAGQKLQWLQDQGFLPAGRQTDPDYWEGSEKWMLRGDLIIDDRPHTLEQCEFPSILFPCEHNALYVAPLYAPIHRVTDWMEIPDLVDELLNPPALRAFVKEYADSQHTANVTREPIDPTTKGTNPKDALGSNKLPYHLWPATATAMGCLGFLDGMLKYGRSNFREMGVRSSIYYDACMRHMNAWFEGEDCAPDSKVPHLAHALACIAIIVDAEAAGKLNDDRMYPGGYHKLVDELTPHVSRLKAVHAEKAPHHYTMADARPSLPIVEIDLGHDL